MARPFSLSASSNAQFDKTFARKAQAEMEKDIKQILSKFKELPKQFSVKARKVLLRKGAKIFREAAKALVPISKKPHVRYKKSATGGDGQKIVYWPRNLQRSIKTLEFRKSPDVFVGPKAKKRGANASVYGTSERNSDPYYAMWVHNGTSRQSPSPYMQTAFDTQRGNVVRLLEKEFLKVFERYKKKAQIK